MKTLGDELTRVAYETLEADFYRAARDGLGARVHWSDGQEMRLQQALLDHALPLARESLARAGIRGGDRWLDIIEARVRDEATGARWITRHWERFGDGAKLVCDYIDQAQTNRPVHQWPEPGK